MAYALKEVTAWRRAALDQGRDAYGVYLHISRAVYDGRGQLGCGKKKAQFSCPLTPLACGTPTTYQNILGRHVQDRQTRTPPAGSAGGRGVTPARGPPRCQRG